MEYPGYIGSQRQQVILVLVISCIAYPLIITIKDYNYTKVSLYASKYTNDSHSNTCTHVIICLHTAVHVLSIQNSVVNK